MSSSSVVVLKRAVAEPAYDWYVDLDQGRDSQRDGPTVDGNRAGTFPSLSAAETRAAYVALRFLPTATLKFELDFKWTLSDLEIRAATLEVSQIEDMENCYVDR